MDSLESAGGEPNQNAFSNVKVGSTTIAADGKTDTLTLEAGSNITLTPDASGDKVTIAATDTNTDTKVNVTLCTTTKAYLLGTSTTPTATAAAVETISDTGVYLDTTAGKLTATSFAGNGSGLTSLNASKLSTGTVPAARLPEASSSAKGAMSAADKAKLDAFGAADTYALKTDLAGLYKYKGQKATVAALPDSGNTAGDVWDVAADGHNYAWNGSAWDDLGGTWRIEYLTNAEIDTLMAES